MDKRLSIYVSSPDSYADVFSVFLEGYRKYWPDCPYEFILTTNTKEYEGIHCICNGEKNDSWVSRTIAALPKIKSKYILLMCDDLIISGTINNDKIEHILDYMDSHNINFCRLNPLVIGEKIDELPILRKVNKQTPYAVNLQIGIFNIDYFRNLLADGSLSAWDIEAQINQKASVAKNENFEDIVTVSQYVIPYVHGVYKGMWKRRSVRMINRKGIKFNIQRPFVPLKLELKIFFIKCLQYKLSPRIRSLLKKIFY